MNKHLEQALPRTLFEETLNTMPGFLSAALDEFLYGADTYNVPIEACTTTMPVYGSNPKTLLSKMRFKKIQETNSDAGGHYIDARKLLVEIRDYLEAKAVAEVVSNNKSWASEDFVKGLGYKG